MFKTQLSMFLLTLNPVFCPPIATTGIALTSPSVTHHS